ncbi:unnamed protein product [Bursaphelenchus okinawaensis]|uniref:Cytochrome b5 heme-binding domain-containing protein n=1 Tax=Bursaphelenchus okinawaensis TaxID=465554 RepID=A0A811JQV3_9BILA|nr:unnamed protein product [Bursaphelenchus okinawaensis]CAG9078142.1 unnamed protein product [Bursaphelenchus okinawaensis]
METDHERPLLFTLKGKLYDVRKFAEKHPGGRKILDKCAGGDLAEYMSGETRIMGLKHEHSSAAYDILDRYAVDHSIEKDKLIDEKTAVLFKVGHLGHKYWTWIHQPYEGSLRLFDSAFLEMLTRTAWWVVPMVWMPVVLGFGAYGLMLFVVQYGLLKGTMLAGLLFILGTLAWTLLEYILHRFVFHWQPDPESYNQILLHFLVHGLHHKTPMDGERLVFPPVPALMIVAVFYVFYVNLLPFNVFCCFAGGKLFGYIVYDMCHYYLHHGAPKPRSDFHFRKVYHHNHHFKDYDTGFGISTVLWDVIFDTFGSGPL